MNFFKKLLNIGESLIASRNRSKRASKTSSARSEADSSKRRRAKSSRKGSLSENKSAAASNGSSANSAPRGRRAKNNVRSDTDVRAKKADRPLKAPPEPASMEILKTEIPDFADFGLGERVLSAVRDMGYKTPTPIQSAAIPLILKGMDIIGTAQTGTGKTAAFSLPIIDMLKGAESKPRVLVLSPTRELASQTAAAFAAFSKYSQLESVLIQGGVSMDRQVDQLRRGADIVVATPGRLIDHMRQKTISLSAVKYLVLDEVDRMFDMGFIDDVSYIIRRCPKQRQTLFFSATMPDAVLRLSNWALKDPERVGMSIACSPAETIEHFVYPVDSIQKYDMIIEILKGIEFESLIVFTRTRMDADRIGEWLAGHAYKVSVLHSDRTQRERDKALSDFKKGKTNILVATDIASRGLDISNVGYVINYNVPEHSEDYVHRIGRTGRANREGKAITLFSSEETEFLKRIETLINSRIERKKLEGFAYRNEPVLEEEIKRPRRRNK